eukprot:Seg5619.2 transcript_id=Seg5619.2/GoldUCD/mRNA.D3Y31 product="F-box/LRR-repeat protein 8" protein_id=Seg5619.2/GoldUCD/D3Y31
MDGGKQEVNDTLVIDIQQRNAHQQANWVTLVPEILSEIFSYLTMEERYNVHNVCKYWRQTLSSPSLWQNVDVKFMPLCDENNELQHKSFMYSVVTLLCNNCDSVRNLTLAVSQQHCECNSMAFKILQRISLSETRKLQYLKLIFTDENPLFFSGKEYLNGLLELFKCPKSSCSIHAHFHGIDLSKFPVCLDDQFVHNLIEFQGSSLVEVNIQNHSLVCNISTDCMHKLATVCRNVQHLAIHMSSFDGETLQIFSESGRKPLQFLSLFCQREDKYSGDIEVIDWEVICKASPELRVKFYFDHTCPIFRVREILKPMIPISVLKLRLLATVTELVYFIANSYNQTLEIFDVTTTSSVELDAAILHLSLNCGKLKELHVWCRLSKYAVEHILQTCSLEKHTLAYNVECES